jgi:Fe-S-cluster containining protein
MIDVWYRDGLRFTCQQCGSCCGYPGQVWLTQMEIHQISHYLGMIESDFRKTYIKEAEGHLTIDQRTEGGCIMLETKTNRCKIYKVRPRQCRSFPFWTNILKNQVTWAKEGTICPGINNGRLWKKEEIQERNDAGIKSRFDDL